MHWNRRYVIKSYIKSSLWLVPFFAVMLYMVVHRITYGIDSWLLRTGQIDEKDRIFWTDYCGSADGARYDSHAKPFFLSIHIRFAARRHSSRRRAVHATDHRNDASAGQRDPVHCRLFCLHPVVRLEGVDQDGR